VTGKLVIGGMVHRPIFYFPPIFDILPYPPSKEGIRRAESVPASCRMVGFFISSGTFIVTSVIQLPIISLTCFYNE